ncbi:PREDICTED: kinesin-like protein KIF3C [Wasmannia auropunctata]|uniref:kinesin-like protein KIF3C n=1 Tax=Wasmannia auropunctata TaxID=64793 RepID=UPI0005F05E07|nr:PREDICTED: kinesin-like protein KIF3C [Wasmannia auropunctata]
MNSGKTYTMMDTSDEPGIISLAFEHMFDAIANTPGREFILRVSYLELFDGKVNDLLMAKKGEVMNITID